MCGVVCSSRIFIYSGAQFDKGKWKGGNIFKLIIRVIFLTSVLAGASGCATMAVMGKANEITTEGYVVNSVQAAWLAENGDLTVCLLGLAPDRSGADFSISIKAGDMATPAEAGSIGAYRVPPDHILTPCRPPADGARPIPVEIVSASRYPGPVSESDWERDQGQSQYQGPGRYQEQGQGSDSSRDQESDEERKPDVVSMPGYLDMDAAGTKIYIFDEVEDGVGVTVLFRDETSVPGGARFTRIDIPMKETYPNAALGLLVPFAMALDGFLIYLCLTNATDCFASN